MTGGGVGNGDRLGAFVGDGVGCVEGTFGILTVGVSVAAALAFRIVNSTPENCRSSSIFFANCPAKSNMVSDISI